MSKIDKEKIKRKIIEGDKSIGLPPLSPDQAKAATTESRYVRILAGAGAGKTETLTRRILYLLLVKNVPPEEIVAFTFTEKAAQSMKSRIYTRVEELAGEEYVKKLGKMFVGTIHSYALQILQDYYGYGNYDVLDEHQEMALISRKGWDLGVNKIILPWDPPKGDFDAKEENKKYPEKVVAFADAVSLVYGELLPEKDVRENKPDFYEVLKEYEQFLDENKRLTFDRLIYLAVKKIEEDRSKLPLISHLIVDEYQDINPAQERFIDLLGLNSNIMVVGDPRQTIYQWRGSDPECFERFKSKYECEEIAIPENRRSGSSIIELGNVIARDISSTYTPMKAVRKIGQEEFKGKVYIASTSQGPKQQAIWIANQIKKLVENYGLNYSDIAVLMRIMRSQETKSILNQFDKNEIPYVVVGSTGLFKKSEAITMAILFAFLWWEENETFLYSLGKVSKEESVEAAWEQWKTIVVKAGLNVDRDDFVKSVKEWREAVWGGNFENLQEIYHDLLNRLSYKELNPNDYYQATVLANLGRFSNLLSDYEVAVRLSNKDFNLKHKSTQKNIFKGLFYFLNNYAAGRYEERFPEEFEDVNAVMISTIHQAKGLEWPVVFIPRLEENHLPSKQAIEKEKKEWLIDRNLIKNVERYDSSVANEEHLFYVAVTRAKDVVVMTHSDSSSYTPSRFLSVVKENFTDYEELIAGKSGQIVYPLSKKERGFLSEFKTYEAVQLIDFIRCPHFYRLRHLWGYDAPLNERLGFGKALHYVLQRVVELKKQYPDKRIDKILHEALESFYMPFVKGRELENLRNAAGEMLFKYLQKHKDDIDAAKEVEYRIEFPLKNAVVTGRVDVVLEKNGITDVRDYKTSKDVSDPEHVTFQLKIYAEGLKHHGFNVKKGAAVYLEDNDVQEILIDENSVSEAIAQAEKIITDLQQVCTANSKNTCFQAKPGEFCERCDFKTICRYAKK